ncbi:endopeptidase La [Ruminococcus sp. AF37-6AT]|jgi:ATP-dependent Lon protease|uniref:endopeptidase La n=1 Tax=Blautia sp. HCN-1074 TaxID=3134667 RepID=UPI000E4516CD|nr:endopeptidase La [uncultured Blautia sp.]RGI58838.1 endopeptidase La [Ruminococcus sp. TM10-9AT]RGW18661.1 endopeptidase La [Ruminococcus sp. AF13-28]RGW18941.1 endopeptidase La [Ruminococcus sp. AF13-37]RGY92413.1 endopeptidase La [Ruminococcus sp. AM58-7XD]RHD89492.1 endopeptidase La [Ruminococcus sp. AM30-15AC]RHJ90567.1 endopeptidase La [Ruminococcus sp. AM07-21]RHL44250.1 endopeptidase La [Ruminococcus sp. AF37-6AT]RHP53939.1 endopeptidase La [Ruminococcus sp. AF31-16BH]RHT61038.1 
MTNQNMVLPAIALRGTTILPGMIVHFDVSRERSVKAIEAAMLHDQKIFLVTQIDPEVETPDLAGVYRVGTVAYIKQVVKLPQNLLRVLVEGTGRATLVKFEQEFPFIKTEITPVDEEEMQMPEPVMEAMHRSLKELFHRYCMENGKVSKELVAQILNIENIEELVEQIAVNIPLSYQNKQKILEALTLEERYEVLGAILSNEIEIMQIGRDLQKKVKARVDKNQREYILREQLKLIREELGEDNTADDAEEFKKKLQELQASDEVKEKISKEIERFKNTNTNVSENAVLRGYIETMLSLPWDKKSVDSDDLKEAWKVLQDGHYGLKDVKERVMEFLSVRKLTHKGKSPILCLVGPPGTGKTSIAKSIAEAMHKKYVRICLGGVRDEAEIRGHRKTYVGAMPGRITAALQQAGVSNPLMLLDEIDKTSSDYKGDTSAALLEVLDPEQNSRFLDHYIEVPQDLSEVLFIATANDVQGIPRPLLDRMELIEIAGYTENEKEHIAKEHLIPKQMEENGIEKGKLTIQTAALKKIINNYTKEAGVRNLERTIGQICRKTARLIMEEDKKKVTVTSKNLSDFLGKEHFNYLMANKKDEIGISRGLAWTQVGGDTLQIEVNVMPGKGELMLTGQLGDVMKESAQAGITYIRSIASDYKVEPEFFQENDIHVHIPEGAVPKDGPSAGITMATAILSAIIKKPVRADLAMTGEITLRGRVLPIGGLKEKLLAAKYAKIKEVLVPAENKPDIQELDKEITDGLTITFVSSMKEVLNKALVS